MKYGLTDKNIEDLKGVLSAYQPIEKAIIYALPDTKTCIALMSDAITPDDLKEIINAVDTLQLPISVLLFSEIADEKVKGLIEQDGLVLFQRDCEEDEWKEYKLGEIIITNALSIKKDYPYSKILYLDTGSITCNKVDVLQHFDISDAPSRAKRLVNDEDVIYSAVRPDQLHYGFIKQPPANLVVSTGFITITCDNQNIYPKYLY